MLSGCNSSSDSNGTTGPDELTVNNYLLVKTGQTTLYDDDGEVITGLSEGDEYYGQDATYLKGATMAYTSYDDGTVVDNNTGLMWQAVPTDDNMTWAEAKTYCENLTLGGHTDLRLPNVKELQSIVDYTKSPTATEDSAKGPAIDSVFNCTQYGTTGTDGIVDYGYYWTSTSANFTSGLPYYYGWYVSFGRAVNDDGVDFHGAGAVRFDTKYAGGEAAEEAERVTNFVRLVRDAD